MTIARQRRGGGVGESGWMSERERWGCDSRRKGQRKGRGRKREKDKRDREVKREGKEVVGSAQKKGEIE